MSKEIVATIQGTGVPVLKVPAIKQVRAIFGTGLRESKLMVEAMPYWEEEDTEDTSCYIGPRLIRIPESERLDLVLTPEMFAFYHFEGHSHDPGEAFFRIREISYLHKPCRRIDVAQLY